MVIMFISKDMERQTEGLDSGQKKLPHSSSSHPEDSSDSADETKHVSYALFMLFYAVIVNAHICLFITHTQVSFFIVSATRSASWDFFFVLQLIRLIFPFPCIDLEAFYPTHK